MPALTFLLLGGFKFSSRHERFTPFGQALFGAAHGTAFGTSNNGFAMAIGGGLDMNASPRFSIRVLQADYLLTHLASQSQNSIRISAGVVFKF
jgi:hypothetical protein